MTATRRLDPTVIRHQIAQLQAAHPDIFAGDDDVLLADTIEGETDLKEFLDREVIVNVLLAEAMAEAIDKVMATLRKRQGRFERRSEVLRTLAHKLMDEAGVRSLVCDAATLSIRTGQPKVIVTDPDVLPDNCVRIKREPDRTAIKDRIAYGITVPGATLSNAEPVLAISK